MKEEKIKLASGLTINTYTKENPKKHPVVFLHGWPASALLWRNIIPVTAGDFHVLAPDLPGYGKSDKPMDIEYSLDFYTNFLIEFLDSRQLDRIHLVAHDIGGMAALNFTARFPERVNRFIIMNTSPYADASLRLKLSLFALRQPWLTPIFLNPFVFRQVLQTGVYRRKRIDALLVDLFRTPWIQNPNTRKVFAKTIERPLDKMVIPEKKIKSIKHPTLILWGKKDIFFPFNIARRLHQDLEKSTLIGVENAAHFCQEEEPSFIARMIRKFLNNETL